MIGEIWVKIEEKAVKIILGSEWETSQSREQFRLVLASFSLSSDGLSLAWHMGLLYSRLYTLPTLRQPQYTLHRHFCMDIGFWPTLAVFLQRIPIVGWLFQQPYIRSQLNQHPFFLLQVVLERQRACLKWQEEQYLLQCQQLKKFIHCY
ncbi:hypothetical protein GOBAR_DD17635 [Gossypium barbadense]|nr:hypothetical protein GOBAR_DD17635 [Gossypium barbadense]